MRFDTNFQKSIDDTATFLKANGSDAQTVTRFSLLMEEILLTYRDEPGFESFDVKCEKHIKTVTVKITVPGRSLNSLENNQIIEHLLEGMENPPVWRYGLGKNTVIFRSVLLYSEINSLKYIWSHMHSERRIFALAVILDVFTIVLGIVLPIFAAMLIAALTNSMLKRLIYMAAVVMVLRLLRDVLIYLYECLYARVYKSMFDSLSSDMTEKMLKIRTESIQEHGSGMFIQRLTDDLKGLTYNFSLLLAEAAEIIQYIGILIGFALISLPLFFYQLITIMLLICIETRRANFFQQEERKERLSQEAYTNAISEIVNANREIKLYRGEKTLFEMVRQRKDALSTLSRQKAVMDGKYKLLRWDLREIFSFIFIVLLVLFVSKGQLSITVAIVLFNYNESMFGAVNVYGILMTAIKLFLLSSERLYQFSISRDFPVEHFGDIHIDRLQGEITFEDVSFSYPAATEGGHNRTILNHMDLHIEPGEYVAITGMSGCGKTTCFNLITKLYETHSGVVKLDGVNIRDLDAESIRSNLAVVSQNPYIMEMTIRENLRVAKNDATEEEMIAACKQACIHDDIMRMPNGYDTFITDGGSNISGGQRQRLSIAMCILKDAPILLMDEATSALDSITQDTVQQNIARLNGTHTVLVIAHRISTIRNCHRILFMNEGRITACGTHEQLLKECPEYRTLYESDRKHELNLVE